MYLFKKKRGICVDYNNSRLGDPQKPSFPRSQHKEQLKSQRNTNGRITSTIQREMSNSGTLKLPNLYGKKWEILSEIGSFPQTFWD